MPSAAFFVVYEKICKRIQLNFWLKYIDNITKTTEANMCKFGKLV